MNTESTGAKSASHRIIRKFVYLLSAFWVREAMQSIFLIYLARHSSETYGQFMLAITTGQILLFISEMGLNQHLATLLARKTDYPSSTLMQITLIKGALLTTAWLCMIGFIFWQGYEPSLRLLFIVIATGIGLESLATSFFVLCQVLGRQDVEMRLRAVAAFAGFGHGFIALFLGAPSLVIGFFLMVETSVNLFGSLRSVINRLHFRIDWSKFRSIWLTWRESIVYTIMAICAILFNKVNMFFLKKYGGDVGVAQYNVTWQLVDGVSILVTNMLLGRVMYPLFIKLFAQDKSEFRRLAQQSARWLVTLALPIMFVFFVESDRIMTLIYGSEYSEAIWMQKYLVVTIFFSFVHNLSAYLMISMHMQRLLMIFYILALTCNLICCSILIPDNPLLGTALAIVITKGFVCCMTTTMAQIKVNIFPLSTLLPILGAVAAGAGLYWLGTTFLFREAGEILAILPCLGLVLLWMRTQRPVSEFEEKAGL